MLSSLIASAVIIYSFSVEIEHTKNDTKQKIETSFLNTMPPKKFGDFTCKSLINDIIACSVQFGDNLVTFPFSVNCKKNSRSKVISLAVINDDYYSFDYMCMVSDEGGTK